MPDIYAGAPITAAEYPRAVTVRNTDSQVNITSTSYTPGDPVVSLTFVAPTSGQVLVTVGGGFRDNSSSNARVHLAPMIRLGGPTGAIAVNPDVASNGAGGVGETRDYEYFSRTSLVSGLIPGATYYAELQHKASVAGGGDLTERDMTVVPVPLGGGPAGSVVTALELPPAVQAYNATQINNPTNSNYVAGTPEVGVTFTAPASGRVLLIVGGGVGNSAGNRILLSPQVFRGPDASGVEIVSPYVVERGFSSNNAAASGFHYGTRETMLSGLIPGETYYARVMYAVATADNKGNTSDIASRQITVVPIP